MPYADLAERAECDRMKSLAWYRRNRARVLMRMKAAYVPRPRALRTDPRNARRRGRYRRLRTAGLSPDEARELR